VPTQTPDSRAPPAALTFREWVASGTTSESIKANTASQSGQPRPRPRPSEQTRLIQTQPTLATASHPLGEPRSRRSFRWKPRSQRFERSRSSVHEAGQRHRASAPAAGHPTHDCVRCDATPESRCSGNSLRTAPFPRMRSVWLTPPGRPLRVDEPASQPTFDRRPLRTTPASAGAVIGIADRLPLCLHTVARPGAVSRPAALC
jgi:hypothetical protein